MKFYRYLKIKRLFDLIFSIILLILFFPLFLLIGICIVLESGSPIIFSSMRVGKNEKEFKLYKFRSLKQEAPSNKASNNIERNKYVTRVGKIIRRTSIDELPQLINVIKGDMSLIGPRPCIQEEKELLNLRKKHDIFSIKPGLSGLAQISGRDERAKDINAKVLKDREYIDNLSLFQDIKIFFITIFVIITGKGYQE